MNINIQKLMVWGAAGSTALFGLTSPVSALTKDFVSCNQSVEGMESAPQEYQTFEHQDLIYRVLSGTLVEVMAVRNMDFVDLVIPDSIEIDGQKYTPVKIGSMVFMGMQNLESVTLPAGMQEIAQAAFISCPKLKEVRFAQNADHAALIKSGAFENCPKLRSVILPDMEVTLEGQVFNGTKSVSLYRWNLDTAADLGEYANLYMGLYDNRTVVIKNSDGNQAPEGFGVQTASTYARTTTGWILKDNQYSYLKNGTPVKSAFMTIAGQKYYFDHDGFMVRGWQEIQGNWYYFNNNGAMAVNTEIDGYHLDSNGIRQSFSWVKVDGKWKFATPSGICLKNTFQEINGQTYYFDRYGMMKTGWFSKDGFSYYAYSDGAVAKDTYIGGYYVDGDGRWDPSLDKPQWIQENGKWKYLHAGGTCTRSGWELIDGEEYYFDEDGWMLTGWIAVNGKWYYCRSTGEKVKDAWVGQYYLDENGIWSDCEWISTSQGKMYRYSDGTYARGWKTINGKKYYFNSQGYLQLGWQNIDGKMYYLTEDGTGGELVNSSRYTKNGEAWSYQARSNLHGVDVSHWQSGIDVANLPGDFIIAKATGGKGFLDSSFTTYAKAAQASGKLFGMYHFARDNGYKGSAKEEAEFFYSVVKDYIGWGVPILDWESDLDLGPAWVEEFLQRFYELSGVKCLLYTSASVTRTYDWSKVANAGYKLWVAQYANNENVIGYDESPWRDSWGTGAFRSVLMHQYTSHGKLPGYSGNLDLDIFYGTKEDWNKLARKS